MLSAALGVEGDSSNSSVGMGGVAIRRVRSSSRNMETKASAMLMS